MLKRFRIEVEEPTADACVHALNSYELALLVEEAKRFELTYREPLSYDDLADLFSRELHEEVIEYDKDASDRGHTFYRGRRVVALKRVDGRQWSLDDGILQETG
jgi:hypothetical protein